MTSATDTEAQTEPWIPSPDSFGARLALVRQRMGWGNVKAAAQACGLPVETWRTWERDGVEPRRLVTIAMTIATKTGCDYLWLVHGPERGGSIRRSAYVGTRVLSTIGQPTRHASTHPQVPLPSTRSVRQTRPLVGGFNRPHTPVAV